MAQRGDPPDKDRPADHVGHCPIFGFFVRSHKFAGFFPTNSCRHMQNQRGARPALMLPLENDIGQDYDLPEVGARVTPLAEPPDWLRNSGRDGLPIDGGEPHRAVEEQFWNEPPRYSLTGIRSLLPEAMVIAPSRLRLWGARLLFAATLCAVFALLALELSRVIKQ
jgi:hypothetical protein